MVYVIEKKINFDTSESKGNYNYSTKIHIIHLYRTAMNTYLHMNNYQLVYIVW